MLQKQFKKNIILRFLLLCSLFIIFISFSAFSYANTISSNISKSVFRLHIIANSDSEEDQNLKYQVRDALLEYMNSLCLDISSKEDAISLTKNHLKDFEVIAENVISANGYTYDVSVEIGEYTFPTKEYGDILLPAGIYDSLRVKIGSATGHNWWCVMFPPLCFVDVSSGIVPDSSKELLNENMGNEEYDLITDSSDTSKENFKFKLVELIENIKIKLANNE